MIKKGVKDSFDKIREELYLIREEVRNDITGPVIASFGFIIALVWRDAIVGALDEYLLRAGLLENAYIYQLFSAIIITIIVIIIMVLVKKWSKKKRKKKIQEKLKEIDKIENLEKKVKKKSS